MLKEKTPRWAWAYNLRIEKKPDLGRKEQAIYLGGKEEKRVRASEQYLSLSLSFVWDKQEFDDGTYSWRFNETSVTCTNVPSAKIVDRLRPGGSAWLEPEWGVFPAC